MTEEDRNRDQDALYDSARRITDGILGQGTYARTNKDNPDPNVQAAIARIPTNAVQRALDRNTWDPTISLTYQCPECGGEVDIREAQAL
jgi:hypothetical protein